jgi:hypothetical protein
MKAFPHKAPGTLNTFETRWLIPGPELLGPRWPWHYRRPRPTSCRIDDSRKPCSVCFRRSRDRRNLRRYKTRGRFFSDALSSKPFLDTESSHLGSSRWTSHVRHQSDEYDISGPKRAAHGYWRTPYRRPGDQQARHVIQGGPQLIEHLAGFQTQRHRHDPTELLSD